nr:MAG TPA: hypothetical protein [Caudoviricetes sp.]
MAKLQVLGEYFNPYEAAHSRFSRNDFYRESDWQTFAKRGELDNYLYVMENTNKLPSFEDIKNDYNYDYLSTDERFTLMANELQGDRTNTDTERTETVYNEATGAQEERTFKMSDYDYTKKLLKERGEYLKYQDDLRIAQEEKDNIHPFMKFLNGVGGVAGHLVVSAADAVDGVLSLLSMPVNMIASGITGEDKVREGFETTDEGSWGNASNWRIFDKIGFKDEILDWEKSASPLVDTDGSYVGLGKYVLSIVDSIGQYAPAAAMTIASGGTLAPVANVLYYGGMYGNTMNEMVMDPRMSTVPTAELILNASLRTTAEWAVQKGLNKLLGSSVLDDIVFGETAKAVTSVSGTGAINRILMDAWHEGIEEVLQDLATQSINSFFGLHKQQFNNYNDWSLSHFADAFIIGALSSVVSSSFSVARSGISDFINRKSNVDPKMNFLAKYEFKRVMSDMMSQYNEIISDKKIDIDTKRNLTGQLYANFSVISKVYNAMGEERFNKAQQLFEKLGGFKQMDDYQLMRFAEGIMVRFDDLRKDFTANTIAEDMKKAQMSDIKAVVDSDTDLDSITDEDVKASLETIKRIYKADPNVQRIVLTTDGNTVVQLNKTLFVPIEYAKNADGNIILKTRAEQDLVQNTTKSTKLAPVLNNVLDIYKQVSGESNATIETATYNLFFNSNFQKVLLGIANRDIYLLMAHLQDTINTATSKSPKDDMFKQRMKSALNALRVNLGIYLVYQQEADLSEVVSLYKGTNTIERIKEQRYEKDLRNRVITDGPTSADLIALAARINSMPASQDIKGAILDKIKSENSNIRASGMKELETFYRNVYNSPYDGKTYMPTTSIQNNLFNNYLQDSGLTITTVTDMPATDSDIYKTIIANNGKVDPETVLAYRRDMFKAFTNYRWDFTIVNGKVSLAYIGDLNQYGYKKFSSERENIYFNKGNKDRYLVTPDLTSQSYISNLLNPKIDAVSRANITVTDVIYNPLYLSESTRNDIKSKYHVEANPEVTFLYLRDQLLNKSKGETSIVATTDDTFQFVNIKPMYDAFKSKSYTIDDISEEGKSLSVYVDKAYITGRLNDTIVMLGRNSEYDPVNNIIYIARDTPTEVTFALAHELQHAIQVENNLNGGLAYDWLTNSNLTAKQKKDIANDIKRHRPDLFKGVKDIDTMYDIAERFIYDTTGETQAYGVENQWDVNDFYPTIVKYNNDGSINITTPWGNHYDIVSKEMSLTTSDYNLNGLTKYNATLKQRGKVVSTITNAGVLLTDGTIVELPNGMEHYEFLDGYMDLDPTVITLRDYSNTGIKSVVIQIDNNKITHAQRAVLDSNINKYLDHGYNITLASIDKGYIEGNINTYKDANDMFNALNRNNNNQAMAPNKNILDIPGMDKVNTYYRRNLTEMQPNSLMGLILPDGTIGFNSKYWTHLDFQKAAEKQFNQKYVGAYNKRLVEIAINGRFGHNFFNSLSIRINSTLSIDQRESLIDFVNDALANGAQIEIEHVPSGAYSSSDGIVDARKLLQNVIRQANAARMSMAKQPGQYKYITRTDRDNPIGKDGNVRYKYTYEHDTYVANKDAEGTNLEHFIKKGRPIQMSKSTQEFVIKADPNRLAPELWDMIGGNEAGTLTQTKVMDYFRNADSINKYTFNLINQCYFQNEDIKSFEQMEKYVDYKIANYYALRGVLRAHGLTDLIYDRLTSDTVKRINEVVMQDPKLKKQYETIRNRYETYKGQPLFINHKAMRVMFMKYFDGTVQSLGYIGAISKFLAINGWNLPGEKANVSLDQNIANKKGGDSNTTIQDTIVDESSLEAFDETLSNLDRKEMMNQILHYTADILREKGIKVNKKELIQSVRNLSDDMLLNMYTKLQLGDVVGHAMSKTELDKELKGEATPIVKTPRRNYLSSIYSLNSTIKRNLSPNEAKKFYEAHSDLFNEDIKVRRELYVGKSDKELQTLREQLRKISSDVRLGAYTSKTAEAIVKSLDRFKKKYEKEKLKAIASGEQVAKERQLKVSGYEFDIASDVEIPSELRAILDTTFETFRKTDVKFLSGEDEVHMQMNATKFYEQNADRLMQLTSEDATSIIDFYQNMMFVGKINTEDIRKFNAFKLYMLGYLYEQGQQGLMHMSGETLARLSNMIQSVASDAGTQLAAFRSILDKINPQKKILQSAARKSGIEFREADIENLIKIVKTNDVKKIENQMHTMYENGLKAFLAKKGNEGKVNQALDAMWKFQRMAMLSSPGTWIRNIVSNNLVSVGNDVGGIIGNLFTGKKHKEGQYKITGTQVSDATAAWVKANFVDNGLMALISDGVSKYDIRKSKNMDGQDIIVSLIRNKVETEIFNRNNFKSKGMNKVSELLFKVLSDDPWINKRTLRYFGKMLTEDNVNLNEGLSNQVMNTFAEAYTMAAWDYMHKPNMFNALEEVIRRKGGSAGYFAWKQFLPFASAGWNWFVEGLNYTPIGLVKAIVDFARLEKTIAKMDKIRQEGDQAPSSRFAEYITKRNIGKGTIGTVGLVIGALLGAAGVMGIDDEDGAVKISVCGVKVDISNLFGTSGLLMGAALTGGLTDKSEDGFKRLWKAIGNTFDVAMQDSFFADLFNMFQYADTPFDWIIAQPMESLNTFVPNILKTFNSLLYNHKVKYSSGILYNLESFVVNAIPGIAYAFPKRVDPYTGKIKTKYKVPFILDLINRMSPIKLQAYEISEVEKQAIANGVKKTELTGRYTDIGELSNKDKQILNEKYGELNNSDLSKLYNDQILVSVDMPNGSRKELRYSQMSTEQRKSAIEKIMTDNAKIAKIYVYTKGGGKYYATNKEWEELRKMGITLNVFKQTNKLKGFI